MRQTEIKNYAGSLSVLQPESLEGLLKSFIHDQDIRISSKSNYERVLAQYFKWVAESNRSLSQLTRVDILTYKEFLFNAGLTSLSVSTYISTVRRFYEWTESNKYYPNIAKGVKSPKRKQQFKKQALSTDQSKDLINYYKALSIRDYAIVCLLLGTGMRTIELIRANVEDITIKGGKQVLMVHGKGKDERDDFVKLPGICYQALKDYLKTKGKAKAGEPLFTSKSNNSKGCRLTTRSISKIAKEGLKGIGLDSRCLTAHSLRHTTAVTILKSGLGIEYAQGVLRHASSNTTQIYIASIKEEMRLQDNTETILNNLLTL